MAEEQMGGAQAPNKTNAILAWIFAPITSFIFLNDKDGFTKRCAKHSMYFGIADVVIWLVVAFVLPLVTLGIGSVCTMVIMPLWSLVSLVVRIMGAVKANNGELFEVPVISGMVKE